MNPSQHSASTKKSQRFIAFEQECRYLLQINTLFSTAIIPYLVYKPKALTDTNKANHDDSCSKTDKTKHIDKNENTQPLKTNHITDKPQQSLAINNFKGYPIGDYFKSIEWVKSIICSIKQERVKLFCKPFESFEKQLKQILLTKPNTTFLDSVSTLLKDYQLHPYFELLHQQCQTITKVYSLEDVNDIIPELAQQIRLATSSHSFKQKLNQFTIRSTKNAAQLRRYCHQLNNLYPTLCVIRLAINPHGYVENTTAKDKAFLLYPYRVADSLEYNSLKAHHQQFIEHLKNEHLKKKWGDEVFVGYAWSIDFLLNKGYSLQILLFFEDSLLSHANHPELKGIQQNILNAWSFNVDHRPLYHIDLKAYSSADKNYLTQLNTAIIQLTQLNRYLKFKALNHNKTFGHGRVSTKKIAYAKQQQENTKRLLTIGSPLMARKPHSLKPTDTVPYQKIALAHLFINQNTVNYDHTYHPLIELNELDSIQQLSLTSTVETLFSLTQLTRQLVSDDTPHYQWIASSTAGGFISASELGKNLYYFLCRDLNAIQSTLSGLTLNAALTLFFKTFMQWQLHHPIDFDSPKDFLLYQALNDFVIQLRNATINDNKRSIFSLDNAHQKAIDKNFRLLKKYTQTLTRKYSSLSIFHVEFSYGQAINLTKSSCAKTFLAPRNSQTSYHRVKNHRQMFFKQLNKHYGKYLVGFAWKLKYSTIKGFYHEWLLFFDESHEQNTPSTSNLYQLWLAVTDNKGSVHFRNCRLNKSKDYRSVIPKEQRAEQKKQLDAMLCSLTLLDEYVYFDPKTLEIDNTDRTFNRGHL